MLLIAMMLSCDQGTDVTETPWGYGNDASLEDDPRPLDNDAASTDEAHLTIDPGADRPAAVDELVATLHPTKGNSATGTVTFSRAADGVQVRADLEGLEPGKHAFHIHLYGDCSAPDGTSAGTHFNLRGSSLNPPESIDRITGNLGELEPGDDGRASLTTTVEDIEFTGPYSILGRSVVVHAEGNDPNEPPIGAAGARQACGVIGIAEHEGA